MAKKWKNPKVKLLSFQKDLQILLEGYDYIMDCRLVVNVKGIIPRIVVDSPENLKVKPTPDQVAKMIQSNKKDVKQEKSEQKPVPEGKKN